MRRYYVCRNQGRRRGELVELLQLVNKSGQRWADWAELCIHCAWHEFRLVEYSSRLDDGDGVGGRESVCHVDVEPALSNLRRADFSICILLDFLCYWFLGVTRFSLFSLHF